MSKGCRVCGDERREAIEERGQAALDGDIPWAQIVREFPDYTHPDGIKNHMRRHYAAPPTPSEAAMDALVMDGDLEVMVEKLKAQARISPPELAPLYAVAARNLAGLAETKPSQQHLIASLKAIQEITNMGTQQQLMLSFAQHQFGLDTEAAAGELGAGGSESDFIDAEVVSDETLT